MQQKHIQGSLFEENYLVRSLGAVAHVADIALTELVANAWDAGASKVKIQIPTEKDSPLIIEDDGHGMTPKQFKFRWMTLGYDRARHQGNMVEFSPSDKNGKRHAYGRNGIGRHGLLCFASKYSVTTKRDGIKAEFLISTLEKDDPFTILKERHSEEDGHGTHLEAMIQKKIPNPDRIREIISARFIHDPQFVLMVNGKSVPPTEHPGLISEDPIFLENGIELKVLFIDSTRVARTKIHQGIAFWVGNRLVGEPSWVLGNNLVIDGRTKFAKRYTFIVRIDGLYEEVKPDWTGFISSEKVSMVYDAVNDHVKKKLQDVSSEIREEAQCSVLRQHRSQIRELNPLAQNEVSNFAAQLLMKQPNLKEETLYTAVEAVINLEKSRSGKELLNKLADFSEDDVKALNELLDKWTVRDALVVLDEIDQRIAIIEAIKKLSKDDNIDELHTLHPLVTQARWLFGPEFDTPEYTSNISLRNTVEKIFKNNISEEAFLNHKKRPDIVVLKDSTLCAVSTEKFDENTGLFSMQTILLLELKRGGATIGRDEMFQAQGYVHDIGTCGLLDGAPFIKAFVIGHKKSKNTASFVEISMESGTPPIGNIKSTTYGQLVMSAEKRLFRLRDFLSERYDNMSEDRLLAQVLNEPEQMKICT
ncbi:MAG: ATP-binding protein [Deltaproteobacteria bacterium]|nr:ATP-binding protein [Deltaproteobacteria bacterium]